MEVYKWFLQWLCLSKNGEEAKTKKLAKYKEDGDEKVLLNTTLITRRTLISFATENKVEYDDLVSNPDYNHIVYTNQESIADMDPIADTFKIFQISDNYH